MDLPSGNLTFAVASQFLGQEPKHGFVKGPSQTVFKILAGATFILELDCGNSWLPQAHL